MADSTRYFVAHLRCSRCWAEGIARPRVRATIWDIAWDEPPPHHRRPARRQRSTIDEEWRPPAPGAWPALCPRCRVARGGPR